MLDDFYFSHFPCSNFNRFGRRSSIVFFSVFLRLLVRGTFQTYVFFSFRCCCTFVLFTTSNSPLKTHVTVQTVRLWFKHTSTRGVSGGGGLLLSSNPRQKTRFRGYPVIESRANVSRVLYFICNHCCAHTPRL